MTERHLLLASAAAVRGRESEFERWCVAEHLPHMLTAPGITAAQSFRTTWGSTDADGPDAQKEFLNIYEIDGPPTVTQDGLWRIDGPWRQLSPAMVRPSRIRYYESLYREGVLATTSEDDRLLLLRCDTAATPREVGVTPQQHALRAVEVVALARAQRRGTVLEPGECRYLVLAVTHRSTVVPALQGLLQKFSSMRPAQALARYRPTGPRQVVPA